MLTKEKILNRLSYNEETGALTRNWKGGSSRPTGTVREDGYIRINVDGKLHYAHRLVWIIFNGHIPDGMQVDHIDCNPSNNKISNLRLATQSQNNHNQRVYKSNSSGVKGVLWNKLEKRWKVTCWLNNKKHNGGTFLSLEEAVKAQKELRDRLHADFARMS